MFFLFKDLLTHAPGLSRGFEFDRIEKDDDDESMNVDRNQISDIIDLRSIMEEIPGITSWSDESKSKSEKNANDTENDLNAFKDIEDSVIPRVNIQHD